MSEAIKFLLWSVVAGSIFGMLHSFFTLEFIKVKSIKRQIYKDLLILTIISIICGIVSFNI